MKPKKAVMVIVSAMAGLALAVSLVAHANGVPKEAKKECEYKATDKCDRCHYVGTNKCRLCHMKEHKTWKVTKHATSFDALKGDEVKNPDCLKCHTTGYGQPRGFVSVETTPNLKGTGCEGCHGPASEHIKAAKSSPKFPGENKKINKTPQNACVKCHNPHVNQKARVARLRSDRTEE